MVVMRLAVVFAIAACVHCDFEDSTALFKLEDSGSVMPLNEFIDETAYTNPAADAATDAASTAVASADESANNANTAENTAIEGQHVAATQAGDAKTKLDKAKQDASDLQKTVDKDTKL